MPKTREITETEKKIIVNKKPKRKFTSCLMVFLFFLVIVAFVVGLKFKGLILVASVNSKPIYSFEFVKYLWKHYAPQALDDLIAEKLLLQEAAKKQVEVSDSEVLEEITQIRKELTGGVTLEEKLEQEKMSYQEFQKGIKLQLIFRKLLEKKINITDNEIQAYIRQNQAAMQATDEAKLKDEARQALRAEKMNEEYQNLIPELKKESNISQFLKF